MLTPRAPTVTIGLPVRNGSNFIAQSIKSILGQTFFDFELVISDNNSTDQTQEICQQFAAQDCRIRYYRNGKNIGAAANYNRTFQLARGQYFKWAAHDDLIAPDYLARCVQTLEERPDAVVCHTGTALIDGEGNELSRLHRLSVQSAENSPSERLAERLKSYYYYDFFGVFRHQVLLGTPLHGPYHNSDVALLAIVALRGTAICLSDYGFFHRRHAMSYSRSVQPTGHSEWHTAGKKTSALIPAWRILSEIWPYVAGDIEDPAERTRCYIVLVKYLTHVRTVNRDLRYMVKALAPSAGEWKRAFLNIFHS